MLCAEPQRSGDQAETGIPLEAWLLAAGASEGISPKVGTTIWFTNHKNDQKAGHSYLCTTRAVVNSHL